MCLDLAVRLGREERDSFRVVASKAAQHTKQADLVNAYVILNSSMYTDLAVRLGREGEGPSRVVAH